MTLSRSCGCLWTLLLATRAGQRSFEWVKTQQIRTATAPIPSVLQLVVCQ
jgi:hypothetical protein